MHIIHFRIALCNDDVTLMREDVPPLMQYAFNLFSHNSPMTENGYNEEEMKMVKETRKIWGNQGVDITATCIRVPIMRAHAESINLELERDMSEEEVCLCSEGVSLPV